MRTTITNGQRSLPGERTPGSMPSSTPPATPSAQQMPEHRSKVGLFVFILCLITLVSLGIAYYSYAKLSQFKKNPQQLAQDEVSTVVAEVGKIMVLPTNEQPTLATVADPSRLKDQPFFANARVGDKVLFYATSRKAILYDPTLNKIVEVAPINIGGSSPADSSSGMKVTQPTSP